MGYFIGLDGGGTKTKCVLTDADLNIISESTGGPSNFLMLGTEIVSQTILDVISETLNQADIGINDVESVVLGTTGAGRRSDAEKLENDFNAYSAQKEIIIKKFRVESDARIALEGAFSGQPGSILIAGTGSIMFGKDKKGEIHRVGGFGRFIGDEGSGYMLGRRGLNAVAKHYDNRGPATLLSDLIREEFNISDPSSLITEIYKNNFDIASVAPFVIQAAASGDGACMNIINDETEELLCHIQSMKAQLNERRMKLSLIGSLLTTDNHYAFTFREKFISKINDVLLKDPDYPPALGAVLMGRELDRL